MILSKACSQFYIHINLSFFTSVRLVSSSHTGIMCQCCPQQINQQEIHKLSNSFPSVPFVCDGEHSNFCCSRFMGVPVLHMSWQGEVSVAEIMIMSRWMCNQQLFFSN